jgi:UDP-N-acetylmuramate dehydrogenase
MLAVQAEPTTIVRLQAEFGSRLQEQVLLARYTAARLGGPADWLLEVRSHAELARAVRILWEEEFPFHILGGGSNVLVSDRGIRGLVLLNRARKVRFEVNRTPPMVWAESGANFGLIARQAAQHGLSGLEWAAGIPGTLGGAVVGNAGAHSADMTSNLHVAEILHRIEQTPVRAAQQTWTQTELAYGYRTSTLKEHPGQAVVLSAWLTLQPSTIADVQAKMDEYVAYRRRTQPPGASLGSMFKNPPGDHAGRLIEAAGLKGARSGGAEISPVHANFFINHTDANAADLRRLIELAQKEVLRQFGVALELEIELLGE